MLFSDYSENNSGKLSQGPGIKKASIANKVLADSAVKTLFPELHSHMFHTTVEDVHLLVKKASSMYCKNQDTPLGKKGKRNLERKDTSSTKDVQVD